MEEVAKAINCKDTCVHYEKCKPFVNPIICNTFQPINQNVREAVAKEICDTCWANKKCPTATKCVTFCAKALSSAGSILSIIQPLLEQAKAEARKKLIEEIEEAGFLTVGQFEGNKWQSIKEGE